MMLNLLLFLLPAAELPAGTVSPDPEAPVKLWMNGGRTYRSGDRVQIQVETGSQGYLFVVQLAPDGRVKVLFPIEPRDDAFVQVGRRYALRDPGDAQSFIAADPGPGLVLAAIADQAWDLTRATREGDWDYGFLAVPSDSRDPEADLVSRLRSIAPPGGFDYDVLDYAVLGRGAITYVRTPGWWSHSYRQAYLYDPWFDCWSCYGPAIHIGFGSRYPHWWYRPYGYAYRPYGYRPYGFGPWDDPFFPRRPVVVIPGRPSNFPTIVGRPRGYTVGERTFATGGSGSPRFGGFRPDRIAAGPDEARAPARRARERSPDDVGRGGRGVITRADEARGNGTPPAARPRDVSRPRDIDRSGAGARPSGSNSPPAEAARPSNRGSSGNSEPARSRPRGGRGGNNEGAATASAPPVEQERSGRGSVVGWVNQSSRSREARPVRAGVPERAGQEINRPVVRAEPQARPASGQQPAARSRATERPAAANARPAGRPEPTARPAARPEPAAARPVTRSRGQERPAAAASRPAARSEPAAARQAPRKAPPPRAAPAPARSQPKPAASSSQQRPAASSASSGASSNRSRPRGRGN